MDAKKLRKSLQELLLAVDEALCDVSDYVDDLDDDAPPLVNLERASYLFDTATEGAIDFLKEEY